MRVIAIDGPAGSGKSTLSKALAQRLGLEYLNTGAMYRAVTFAVLQAGGDPADEEFAATVARNSRIRINGDEVTVDGVDASVAVRGQEVNLAVSAVAAHRAVRDELVAQQREWVRRRGGGVVEGRDIGTVVFPDAELKVYLTVEHDEGAQRRAAQDAQLTGPPPAGSDAAPDASPTMPPGLRDVRDASRGLHQAPDSTKPDDRPDPVAPGGVSAAAADLARRNHLDSTRAVNPLKKATDAIHVDTTAKTCEETADMIIGLLEDPDG